MAILAFLGSIVLWKSSTKLATGDIMDGHSTGYTKPMNEKVLNHLANELLTAYWDDLPHDRIAAIAKKYGVRMGDNVFNQAVEVVTKLIADPKFAKANLSEENKGKLLIKGVAKIAELTGGQLGKEISFVNDGLMIDGDCLEKLMESLSPEDRAEFKATVKMQVQDPFQMLEDSLGVPFFTKLEAIVRLRIASLSDVQAAEYLAILLDGMTNKHHWLKEGWEQLILAATLGDRLDAVVAAADIAIEEDMNDVSHLVFDDLLTAMGRIDQVEAPEIGLALSEDDLMALDKVFRGPERSFAEIAEVLRRKKFTQ